MVSGFSQGVTMVAIPWYFIETMNLATFFGAAFAVITFLTLPWSLFAGTITDRYPRKNVFLGLTGVGLLVALGVSLSGYATGAVPAALMLLLFGSTIFIYNVHYPTLYAFGQEVSQPHEYGRTNSLLEVQGQFTSVIAGALATMLLSGTGYEGHLWKNFLPFDIEPWELHEIFMMDACTYAIAFIIILFIPYKPDANKAIDTGSVVERFMGGVRFLRKNKLLIHFGIATYAVFVVVIVTGFYLMAMYVSQHLQRQGDVFGTGEMLYAFGAIGAGFFIRWIFKRFNAVLSIIVLMVIASSGLFLCAITKITPLFLAFCFALGLCNAGIRIMRITYLFEHIPNRVIGRANSIFAFTNIFMRGSLLLLFSFPLFSSDNGVTTAYFIMACLVAASLVPLLIFYRKLNNLEVTENPADPETSSG